MGGEQPGARYDRAMLRTLIVRDPAETVPATPRLRACAGEDSPLIAACAKLEAPPFVVQCSEVNP